jgi:N-acetylmuramoyl-L-alanine amidase
VRHRAFAAALAAAAVLQAVVVSCRAAPEADTAALAPAPVLGNIAPPAVGVADPETVELATSPSAPDAPSLPEVKAVLSPSGVLVPVLEGVENGWRVSTPCGREAVIPAKEARAARHVTVVLDPGHGGWDPGAVGPNGLSEAAVNLAVSREAKAALERAGVSVALTRNADHGMNLANRARLAQSLGAKAFVSVHHNAPTQTPSDGPGSETFYQQHSEESKRLAGVVWEEVVAALRPYAVRWVSVPGAGATWKSRARDGDDYYAMVRLPKPVPATLVELAFISNAPEAELLARPDVQRAEGEAVAKGILRFLTTSDPGSGYVAGGVVPPRPRPGGGRGDDACDDPPL